MQTCKHICTYIHTLYVCTYILYTNMYRVSHNCINTHTPSHTFIHTRARGARTHTTRAHTSRRWRDPSGEETSARPSFLDSTHTKRLNGTLFRPMTRSRWFSTLATRSRLSRATSVFGLKLPVEEALSY